MFALQETKTKLRIQRQVTLANKDLDQGLIKTIVIDVGQEICYKTST